MGNLGRPGYGATADGLWPYTFVALYASLLGLDFDVLIWTGYTAMIPATGEHSQTRLTLVSLL